MEVIKKNIISIVLFLLTIVGGFTWSLIQKGGQAEFNEAVDARINEKLENPIFVKMLLSHPEVLNFTDDAGMKIRNAIIEDVMKKDTNKISMRSFLGKEVGVRDEKVLPLMAALLKAFDEGKLMTEDDVEALIKKRRSRHVKL
jgi:hypothetical protein